MLARVVAFINVFQNYEHLFNVNEKSAGGSFYLQSKVITCVHDHCTGKHVQIFSLPIRLDKKWELCICIVVLYFVKLDDVSFIE